ncbi:uncharacterized protein LOC132695812 [Cylas formicarius]|uniref:uncharacterized protein LOC132695812 n=1 Tax=Cylas formicarius TaxID=197179 RepID=UPI002958D3F9|nr:uncharacterized protein LOC132695812 [Cylas formicarius]
MTSTNYNVGLSDEKNSSRVLRPPGGGHTDFFAPADAQPVRKVNQRNASSITEGTNINQVTTSPIKKLVPPQQVQTEAPTEVPNRIRVPPGGFSSGLWFSVMTSTSYNVGFSDGKNSSRVLRPPGGGHTDLFGPADAQPVKKGNQRNVSSITEGTNINQVTPSPVKIAVPPQQVQTEAPTAIPSHVKVPPGGFSSGLW